MNFSALVMSCVGIAPAECRNCPDQYVGELGELKSAGVITNRTPAEDRPETGALIIVLESPHSKEFEGEPGPAKGTTGLLLAKHLGEVFSSLSVENPPVILMNAVQYQCSLGCVPTMYRDKVFTAAWSSGARQDFISRLSLLYRPGDYVLCCCTKGNNYKTLGELRQKVFAAIVESVQSSQVLRRTHPSSWYQEKNRKHEWPSA